MSATLAIAEEPSGKATGPIRIFDDVRESGPYDAPMVAGGEACGTQVLAPNTRRGVVIANAGGSRQQVLDPQTSRWGQVRCVGDSVYATWWRKTRPKATKKLFFAVSGDKGQTFSSPRPATPPGGVLANYAVASDGQGKVALVYLDERHSDYAIYFNRSTNDGVDWPAQDLRLDAVKSADGFESGRVLEPTVDILHGALVVTWKAMGTYPDKRNAVRLVSRVSRDFGVTWSEPVVLFEDAKYVVTEQLTVSDGEHLYYGGLIPGHVMLFRTADGVKWEQIDALPGADKVERISQLRLALDSGYLHAVFVGRREQMREHVFYARLNRANNAWGGEPVQIGGDLYDLTQSINPQIAVTGEKTVAVAWQDFRSLRPNVVLNYSLDAGKTWLIDPLPVSAPGAHRNVYPQLVSTAPGQVAIFFARHGNDAYGADMSYYRRDVRIDPEKGADLAPRAPFDDKARLERLKQRVTEFWKLRTDGKLDATYPYWDPFYRARVTEAKYAGMSKPVRFLESHYEGAELKGNLAIVKVKYRLDVPETIINGEKFSMEPRDDVLTAPWVWMDGDWFAEFKPSPGQGTAFLKY